MADYAQADVPQVECAVAGVDLLARKTLLFRPDPQPKALFAAIIFVAIIFIASMASSTV